MKTAIFYLILFILTFLACNKNDREIDWTALEQGQNTTEQIELNPVPAKTFRKLVKQRKEQKRDPPAFPSPFENILEIGPNKTELSCPTSLLDYCVSGMVKEFVIDSQDEKMFVLATETGGGWVSYDQGAHWSPIDDDWAGLKLNWVTQSTANPDIYYFCSEGSGLLIWNKNSTAGMQEWVGTIDGVPGKTFDKVAYLKNDPNDPKKHYLATSQDILQFDGNAYEKIKTGESPFIFSGDFEVHPEGRIISNRAFEINTFHPDGTLSKFDTGEILLGGELAFSPSDSNIVYSFNMRSDTFAMYRSYDGGINWNNIELPEWMSGPRHQYHDQTLEIYPYGENQEVIFVGTVTMKVAILDNSHIETPVFKILTPLHADHHGTVAYEENIYFYNDGGLFVFEKFKLNDYFSDNDYVSILYQSLVNGLSTLQTTDIAFNKYNNKLALGIYHNGSWIKTDNGEFKKINGGDGFESAFHPNNQNIVYTSYQKNNLYRYNIETDIRSDISKLVPSGPFRTKMFTHPFASDELFFLDDGIWSITNAASCIEEECSPVKLFELPELALARFSLENSSNAIYAISSSILMKLENPKSTTGTELLNLNDSQTAATLEKLIDIYVGTENGEEVIYILASQNELNQFHIIKIDAEGNIIFEQKVIFAEGIEPTRLFINPLNNENYIIGTNGGLFIGQLGHTYPISELNIPPTHIFDFEYNSQDSSFYIATYGRGIWQAKLKKTEKVDLSLTKPEIYAYPNPASDLIRVSSEITEDIILMDIQGKVIKNIPSETMTINYISVINLAPGMYILYGKESKTHIKLLKY